MHLTQNTYVRIENAAQLAHYAQLNPTQKMFSGEDIPTNLFYSLFPIYLFCCATTAPTTDVLRIYIINAPGIDLSIFKGMTEISPEDAFPSVLNAIKL